MIMIVQKLDVRKDTTSCNFCSKGQLNIHRNGLIYPYEAVYQFKREGSGLCAVMCEECLNELFLKTGMSDSLSNEEQNKAIV